MKSPLHRLSWTLLAAAVALSACDDRPPPAAPAVRDSAGVRIVENPGPADSAPELSSRPVYRTGWRDGEPNFERLWNGRLLDGGRAVVADAGRLELFFLSPEGEVDRRVGRGGDGPGEFRSIRGLVRVGADSIAVHDRTAGRITILSTRGEVLGSGPWAQHGVPGRPRVILVPFGATPDRSLLFAWGGWAPLPGPEDGWAWVPGPIVRGGFGAESQDTIVELDAVHFKTEGRYAFTGAFPEVGFVAGTDSGWVYGRNDRSEIRWYGGDGTLRQVARWASDPAVLTPEMRERVLAIRMERAESHPELSGATDRVREFWEAELDRHEGPLPHFQTLDADPGGSAWLGHHSPVPGPPEAWEVLRSDGRWLGTVEAPETFRILDVHGDRVLGVETDEWDVPAVAVYRVEWD